jgi:plastocyanin
MRSVGQDGAVRPSTPRPRRPLALAAFAVTAVFAAACGGGSDSAAPTGPVTPVSVIDNQFVPAKLTIKVGTTVEWTNQGKVQHNIVSAQLTKLRKEATDFGPGATYRYKFDKPGTYEYFCSLHGTRNGTGQFAVVEVTA